MSEPKYKAVTLIWVFAASICSADDDAQYQRQLAARRCEYVQWVADTFGELEPTMDPRDGRRWALNHARLTLNRDLDEASRHFASFGPLPRDADIYFVRYKAIDSDENKAWPTTWPGADAGSFDDYWYSCYLTFQQGNELNQ